MVEELPKKRTIFILYIPGGGMMGLVPAIVLSRLEQLTETPAIDLFQVVNGVSTGAILAAGLTAPSDDDPRKPKMMAKDLVNMFCQHGPHFFPTIPQRYSKMLVFNALNTVEDFVDPSIADREIIDDIAALCDPLIASATNEEKATLVKLKESGTARWLTRRAQRKAVQQCETLTKARPELADTLTKLKEMIQERSPTGKLGFVFRKSALVGMDAIRNHWAKDFLYDPKVMQETYKQVIGDRPFSEALRSTYISTYDLHKNHIWTFYNRKSDFFSRDPATPSEVSRADNKLWDAVMASTANPFAFPPHVTEDGMLCSDKAPFDTPLPCVLDVLKRKPADADVKLIVLGTGDRLAEENNIEKLRADATRYGVLGNLLHGQELPQIERYNMSQANLIMWDHLGGKNNIIEITPRLAPRSRKEKAIMPSKDILDATPENIRKIMNTAFNLLQEKDDDIRGLAKILAQNLHAIGQMDDAKYNRIIRKIETYDACPVPAFDKLSALDDVDLFTEGLHTLRDSFTSLATWLAPPAPEQDNGKHDPNYKNPFLGKNDFKP